MCNKDEHNYVPVDGSAYYKKDGSTFAMLGGLPRFNQSVSYKMIVCSKCGDSKEIIAQDHRGDEN